MAKKMPVGTIRTWASGDVIKAHDNSIFSSGWIPLTTSEHLDEIGRECDRMGNSMITEKLPIAGEKFLDHEISNYKKEPGKEFGPYVPDDFKQYSGFYGAGRYSFRNEFSKRFMNPKIKLAEMINEALMEANEDKARDLGKHESQFNEIHLSDEETKKIRARVRAEFKHSDHAPMSVEEAEGLKGVVERTFNQLRQGLNFEGKEKEVYDAAVLVANSLPKVYERIAEKKAAIKKSIDAVNETFPDNWGVRESFKSYIDDKYSEYIRKFRDQIYKDEAASQEKLFGIKLDAEPDKFYPKLYERVGEDILAQKAIKLKDHKGKSIFLNNGNRIVIGENSLVDKNNEQEIKEQLLPPKYPYKELVQLRFELKYGKMLEGNWPVNTLMAIHNIENIMSGLPPGHFLNNKNVRLITNTTFRGGENGGYAWYNGGEKRINLSGDCVSHVQIYGKLSNPEEFNCTMAHEVGHAVSDKFGRDGNLQYKRFVVECGWSYQQKPVKDGVTATGNDKDIKREGSNADRRLITKYAQKSPEEAFAEYYSFYYNNKKTIDQWLTTGDESLLKRKTELHVSDGYTGKPLSHFTDYSTREAFSKPNEKVEKLAYNLKLNFEKNFDIDLINPWKTKMTESEEEAIRLKTVGERKGWNPQHMPPAVVVKEKEGYVVINGGHRREQSKIKKKMLPVISVSPEAYTQLKQRGITDLEISNWAYNQNKDKTIPYQDEPTRMITGMSYRNKVVPVTVIKGSHNIFKEMKKIFDSPELQKALQELGFESNKQPDKKLSWKNFKKALASVFNKAEIPYEQKKQFADVIIRNPKGEVLLLLRGNDNKVRPNQWCLPGGHQEEGEAIYDCAKRELFEETGIQSDLMPVTTVEKDDCVIHYYEALLPTEELPQLDNDEHFNGKYVAFDDISDYDLIFDLGETLGSLKENLLPLGEALNYFSNPEEAIAFGGDVDLVGKWIELNSLFDQEQITEEDYFPKLAQIQKAASMELITRAFDDDVIDVDQYSRACDIAKDDEGVAEEYSLEHLQKIAKSVPSEKLQQIIA